MGHETTENELGRVAAAKAALKAPPPATSAAGMAASAAPPAGMAASAAKAPPKAPPQAPPQASISARIEMHLKRLEEKIDDTKEAMVAFQTQNRAIAENQQVLNEQNKEILHLLHVQRINEQIAREASA
jgi:hypothetical protein